MRKEIFDQYSIKDEDKAEDENINLTRSDKLQNYWDIIHDLKVKYQNKEKITRKLIKEDFPPPQLAYDKFMAEIDNWNMVFTKQTEIALNIIDIGPECTEKVENELLKRIDILKSFVIKMEELAIEFAIYVGNSSKNTENIDLKELLDDMQKVIVSVKEYD